MSLKPRLDTPFRIDEILADAAKEIAKQSSKAFRLEKRRDGSGKTLRPGKDTPLWNALLAELAPHLEKHGVQAQLARLLGLDRQAVHAIVKARTRMPDAERTLQFVAWLMAVREGRPPA
jgi:predicted aminopeptidase